MATIRQRGNSYQIRVSAGYDATGKQIMKMSPSNIGLQSFFYCILEFGAVSSAALNGPTSISTIAPSAYQEHRSMFPEAVLLQRELKTHPVSGQ